MADEILSAFRQEDERSASLALSAEIPTPMVTSFKNALKPLLIPHVQPFPKRVPTLEMGPVGEVPPEVRRMTGRDVIQGRPAEVVSRATFGEKDSANDIPGIPAIDFHLIIHCDPKSVAYKSAGKVAQVMKVVDYYTTSQGLSESFDGLRVPDPGLDVSVLKAGSRGANFAQLTTPQPDQAVREYVDVLYNLPIEQAGLTDIHRAFYLTEKVKADKEREPNVPHIYVMAVQRNIGSIIHTFESNPGDSMVRIAEEVFDNKVIFYSMEDGMFIYPIQTETHTPKDDFYWEEDNE